MFQESSPPDDEVQKNAIIFKKLYKNQENLHFAISTLHSCLFNDLHSEPPKRLFCYLLFCYFFVFAFPHNLGYAQGGLHNTLIK